MADQDDQRLASETDVFIDLNGYETRKIEKAYMDISELAEAHHGRNLSENLTHENLIERAKELLEPRINPYEDTFGTLRLQTGFCFRRNSVTPPNTV